MEPEPQNGGNDSSSANEKQIATTTTTSVEEGNDHFSSDLILRIRKRDSAMVAQSNRMMGTDFFDRMKPAFAAKENKRVLLSYRSGVKLDRVDESASVISVAIEFIPGADLSIVNLMEGRELTGDCADQMYPSWRALTAGAMLVEREFQSDLTVKEIDLTPQLVAAVKAKEEAHTNRPGNPINALIRPNTNDTLTIDSDQVKLLHSIADESVDLRGTCVEVDGHTLFDIMCNYNSVINRSGQLSEESKIDVLETMIEATRRLFVRSPILSRMTNRYRVINSTNTVYGADNGHMFHPMATSKAIAEMIARGASYFKSLDDSSEIGSNAHVGSTAPTPQQKIRSKFMQMMVFLLSLLNDKDLKRLRPLLEAGFSLKADRPHLELTFLKVLPLMSLSPKTFLSGLLSAFDNRRVEVPDSEDEQRQLWDEFIHRITEMGFFLPGGVGYVGGDSSSWKVEWRNYMNSTIFDHLQYGGEKRAMNHIPPIKIVGDSIGNLQVTAELSNRKRYALDNKHLNDITLAMKGRYVLFHPETKEPSDLIITESEINAEIYDAVNILNDVSKAVSEYQDRPSEKKKVLTLNNRKPKFQPSQIKPPAIITRSLAMIKGSESSGHNLAATYKLDGKKVNLQDVQRNLNADLKTIAEVLEPLKLEFQHMLKRSNLPPELKSKLSLGESDLKKVEDLVNKAEEKREKIPNDYPHLGDEPINHVYFPSQAFMTQTQPWSPYKFQFSPDASHLEIDAKRFTVQKVTWDTDVAELHFIGGKQRAFVSPLVKITEDMRDDEVSGKDPESEQEGDHVVLAGGIALILQEVAGGFLVMNCMKLTGFDQVKVTRRRGGEGVALPTSILL